MHVCGISLSRLVSFHPHQGEKIGFSWYSSLLSFPTLLALFNQILAPLLYPAPGDKSSSEEEGTPVLLTKALSFLTSTSGAPKPSRTTNKSSSR